MSMVKTVYSSSLRRMKVRSYRSGGLLLLELLWCTGKVGLKSFYWMGRSHRKRGEMVGTNLLCSETCCSEEYCSSIRQEEFGVLSHVVDRIPTSFLDRLLVP